MIRIWGTKHEVAAGEQLTVQFPGAQPTTGTVGRVHPGKGFSFHDSGFSLIGFNEIEWQQ